MRAHFPSWHMIETGAEVLLDETIDVRPIEIDFYEFNSRRILVNPGESIPVNFRVINAEDPSLQWRLTSGSIAGGGAQTTDEESGTLLVHLPDDPDVYPVRLSAQSLSTTGLMADGRYRGNSLRFVLDTPIINPGFRCLDGGESIELRVDGLFVDSEVRWETDRGTISPTGPSTARLQAPEQGRDSLNVKATVTGTTHSGARRFDIARARFDIECKCWWNARVDGGAAGSFGGKDAVFTPVDDTYIISMTGPESSGIILSFSAPPNPLGGPYQTWIDVWYDIHTGGSMVENELGGYYPNQLHLTALQGTTYHGHFTGRYLPLREVQKAAREERAPQGSPLRVEFAADTKSCH